MQQSQQHVMSTMDCSVQAKNIYGIRDERIKGSIVTYSIVATYALVAACGLCYAANVTSRVTIEKMCTLDTEQNVCTNQNNRGTSVREHRVRTDDLLTCGHHLPSWLHACVYLCLPVDVMACMASHWRAASSFLQRGCKRSACGWLKSLQECQVCFNAGAKD